MGVRGNKQYETLFGIEEDVREQVTRGRDPELIERRNDHMLYRFVWYGSDRRNAYAWIVEQLSKEFYLTESTIGQIIEDSDVRLKQIRNENLNEKQIAAKFPFFKW